MVGFLLENHIIYTYRTWTLVSAYYHMSICRFKVFNTTRHKTHLVCKCIMKFDLWPTGCEEVCACTHRYVRTLFVTSPCHLCTCEVSNYNAGISSRVHLADLGSVKSTKYA